MNLSPLLLSITILAALALATNKKLRPKNLRESGIYIGVGVGIALLSSLLELPFSPLDALFLRNATFFPTFVAMGIGYAFVLVGVVASLRFSVSALRRSNKKGAL